MDLRSKQSLQVVAGQGKFQSGSTGPSTETTVWLCPEQVAQVPGGRLLSNQFPLLPVSMYACGLGFFATSYLSVNCFAFSRLTFISFAAELRSPSNASHLAGK